MRDLCPAARGDRLLPGVENGCGAALASPPRVQCRTAAVVSPCGCTTWPLPGADPQRCPTLRMSGSRTAAKTVPGDAGTPRDRRRRARAAARSAPARAAVRPHGPRRGLARPGSELVQHARAQQESTLLRGQPIEDLGGQILGDRLSAVGQLPFRVSFVRRSREAASHDAHPRRPSLGGFVQRVGRVHGRRGSEQMREHCLCFLRSEGQLVPVDLRDQPPGTQGRQRPSRDVPGRQNDAEAVGTLVRKSARPPTASASVMASSPSRTSVALPGPARSPGSAGSPPAMPRPSTRHRQGRQAARDERGALLARCRSKAGQGRCRTRPG